jgi:DNA-binding response OmpR family regulator
MKKSSAERDKVLIVDDEVDTCNLLSGILKQQNLNTGFVNTLSDAVVVLKNDTPSFLFLDNMLPDGSGVDFIPFVKKNYPQVKVVMITAYDSSADRKKAYEQGADFFIGKPFSRKMVNAILHD